MQERHVQYQIFNMLGYDPRSRFPWGGDPTFKGGSNSCSSIDENQVPEPEEWYTYLNSWYKQEFEKEVKLYQQTESFIRK